MATTMTSLDISSYNSENSNIASSPIVLIVFNRPQTTERVIEAIKAVQPKKILVIADGPRQHIPGEIEKCEKVRNLVDRSHFGCEVLKNYSDSNLGCAKRVSSGLDWVFSTVEEAVILEDDCIPHPTFFRYCDELLNFYRNDSRIMSICGLCVPGAFKRSESSYHFSSFQRCWGWASWRRAWNYYDHEMQLWPQVSQNNLLSDIFHDKKSQNFWHDKFQKVYKNEIDSWAYRWLFSCWMQSGLSILPNVNLISNIGTGLDATNTINDSFATQLIAQEIQFPMKHPSRIVRDSWADKYIQRTRHNISLMYRVKEKLKRLAKK